MRDVAELNFYVVERLTFSGKILFFRFFSFSYRAVKKATGFHEVHHCHNIIATDFLEMVNWSVASFWKICLRPIIFCGSQNNKQTSKKKFAKKK